ncbi:MAG TPA: FkbM family methyltransferase [Candidatus Udaeobacter sp.]|nr:FkbM family methyltransferase [Candidatus Udaeobacter sp.]
MPATSLLHNVGNKAYLRAFPAYRLFYRAFKAYTDRGERQLLRRILFRGAVVVDAGANIGIYSQFLSRCVGPTGVVHSFEPSPENFGRLQFATRNLANVRLSRAAVGERSGRSKLYVSDELNVDHRTYIAEGDSRDAVPIDIVALDDYFKPGQRVDLIKMDIQGYELHALRGARRVIEENVDINVLLEFWPSGLEQAGVRWEELVQMLQSFNLELALVRTRGLIPFDARHVRTDPLWYVNLFARRRRE